MIELLAIYAQIYAIDIANRSIQPLAQDAQRVYYYNIDKQNGDREMSHSVRYLSAMQARDFVRDAMEYSSKELEDNRFIKDLKENAEWIYLEFRIAHFAEFNRLSDMDAIDNLNEQGYFNKGITF